MSDDKTEQHNELAPRLFRDLVGGTNHNESESMVVLESVVFGVLSLYAKLNKASGGTMDERRYMGEMLTALHNQVIGRMGP